jgi:hypothetical protein
MCGFTLTSFRPVFFCQFGFVFFLSVVPRRRLSFGFDPKEAYFPTHAGGKEGI